MMAIIHEKPFFLVPINFCCANWSKLAVSCFFVPVLLQYREGILTATIQELNSESGTLLRNAFTATLNLNHIYFRSTPHPGFQSQMQV